MALDPDVASALAAEHEAFGALLSGLGDDQWRAPTRCAGWTVADVVLHVSQSDQLAVASLTGRLDAVAAAFRTSGTVDDAADAMVREEQRLSPMQIRDRWLARSTELRRLVADDDDHRRVQWVVGQLSVRTLAATRLAEAWIHGGDIADALGVAVAPTERLRHVARLAWRTLPYAFARAGRELGGPVRFVLRGPTGTTWDLAPDDPPTSTIAGDGAELCLVAARRVAPEQTGLRGEGPDAEAVLSLVRTYA